MKKCIYCSEFINTKTDDFKKVGSKYVCALCYDDFADEIDRIYDADEDEENNFEEED